MPGNEFGDRVHNFFAQENSSQGQHQSHVVEGNWPVLNNNFWVGSQRQIDVLNSSSKSYNSQSSDVDRGQASYPVHATHGFNFSQPNLRPDFSKSQPLSEHQHSNGFIYGNQFYQNRQSEANFLAVDTDSDQRHIIAPSGLSVHELQQGHGHEQQAKASDRSETPVLPVSFDLFGGQQQMSHQQASMLQAFQHQQSGLNDMQQQQQQLMVKKMQELQRQQQIRQLDLRPQNLSNQVPHFTKQASGCQSSTLVNGTPNSDVFQYSSTAELGANWLSRSSSAMQGSSSGLVFPPNLGQTQRLLDFMPQQADQSLYGVPVSSSRGLAVNQYSQRMQISDRSAMAQMAPSSNSLHSNQHNFLPDQISAQEGTSISGQKFQNENIGHASIRSLNTGIMDNGSLQQLDSTQRNAPQQDFLGRQELATRLAISHERSTRQVSSTQNEVALDPTEEKILYGSDDNIWAAFGKSPDTSVEAGNLFDSGGLPNGFPSMQSGSWSALMQSAVAETSSSDIGPQEEWSGLIFQNTDGPSANQTPSMHNDNVKQASLPDESIRYPSALGSRSIPPSDDLNTHNVMGLSQVGDHFQNEPGQRVPTDGFQRLGQSSEEACKWSNRSPLQKSVAEGSLTYGNASHHSLDAARNVQKNSQTWAPGQSGARQQTNGWNALAVGPSGGDRAHNNHEAEKLSQNSQNNQLRLMQGGVVPGSSLWKSNPVSSEFGPVQPAVGNHQADKGVLSLRNATDSVTNSCNTGVGDGTNPFVQNNYLLNQWKNAYPAAKFREGEGLGRMLDQVNEQNQGVDSLNDKDEFMRHDMENSAMNENSNDSHRSNLSQHASGGFRVSGLSDVSDSKSMPKQKSNDQLARKVTGPPKFQYHPMGNLDEDVRPPYGLKQATQVQAVSLQNTHFGQSKFFGQVPRNSTVTEKGELQKDNKGPDGEPSHGSFPGYVPRMSVPSGRPPDKAASPSQNMLELLHKVDQSRDHGAMRLSSDCNASSQPTEAVKFDGSTGRLQHSQSSVSQGFGLQLGPPSQRSQIPDLSSSSQNAQRMVNSLHPSHADAEVGEKGLLMVPTSSVQSSPLPNEESQFEFENDSTTGPGHNRKEKTLNKVPGNYHPAFSSDTPYARSQLQNKQMTRLSGKMGMNQHIDSSFNGDVSRSMQRGSPETVVPDASCNVQKDNLAPSGDVTQQPGTYDLQERGPSATASTRDQMWSSQHFGMPTVSRQVASANALHNMWSNVPTSHHTLAAHYAKAPSRFSELPQPNIVESSSQHDLGVNQGRNLSSKLSACHANFPGVDGEEHRLKESSGQLVLSVNIDSATEMAESMGKASQNHLDDSPANSASTQKDIEAFGRSLKPIIFTNKKAALLNQMRVLKDADTSPSIGSKRIKGLENILDVRQVVAGQQNEDNVGDSLGSSTGVNSDPRMASFSMPPEILQRNTPPHGNDTSQDILPVGLDASQCNPSADATASVRVDHHQVSPQMAPSWFSQYGSLKNGQMLPTNNAHKASNFRPGEPPFPLRKSASVLDAHNVEENSVAAPTDACRVGTTLLNSASTSGANENLFSPQSVQLNVTGQHEVILRPKKRKIVTYEHHPWYKEISDGSQNLATLSVAEADWNKAANRLTEKVEDDTEFIEDGPPVLRSKRRLILTTQLMQQLFRPPPATILSVDSSSKYESVTYVVSRVALGDACSIVSRSSGLGLSRDGVDKHSIKGRLNDGPHVAKVIEELLGKTRKLESDFLRLDKSASILDLRVECQDLEKFSIINRFAKFHGRGQTDNVETASTDATAAIHKPCAQRYVTAVAMPRNLPDRVQCLSL